MNSSDGGQIQCPCCKECKDCTSDFQKVVDLKNAGLVIYRHTSRTEDVDQNTGIIGFTTNVTEDVFILHNTKNIELTSADYLPEFEKNTINCPRCRRIIEHAQKLLQKVPIIDKNNVKGICEHCRTREASCIECKEIVKKFLSSKSKRLKHTKERVQQWLSKIKKMLKDSMVDTELGNERVRAHSELYIDQLCRESPKHGREPDVKQMFHPETDSSDFVKVFPSSIEKRKKMFAHFPQFEGSGKKRMRSADKDKLFVSEAGSDMFIAPLPIQEHKIYKHVVIGKIIPPVPFQSEEDIINMDDSSTKFEQVLRPTFSKSHHASDEEPGMSTKRTIKTSRPRTFDIGPETILSDFGTKRLHLDAKATKPDRGAELDKKLSFGSMFAKKEPSESLYELRKYHSNEALLNSVPVVTRDIRNKDFSYVFPKVHSPVKKKVVKKISSSDLIKDTQDMLLARAEEERKRQEDVRKRKLEEEERKRIARVERRKLLEAEKKAEEERKRLEEIEKAEQDRKKREQEKEIKTSIEKKEKPKQEKVTPTASTASSKSKLKESRTVSEKKEPKLTKPQRIKETKEPKAPKEPKVPTELKEPKAPRTPKEPKEAITHKEPKSPKALKEPNEAVTPKEPKSPKEHKAPKELKAPKEPKAPKELMELKEPKELKPPKEPKETIESKATNEIKLSKKPKEAIETKEIKTPKESMELNEPKIAIPKDSVGPKTPKESKASKESMEKKEQKEPKITVELIELKAPKELKEPKEPKDRPIETKEYKETKEPKVGKDDIKAEKDAIKAEKNAIKAEKDAAKAKKEQEKKEREEQLRKEKDMKQIEKDLNKKEKEALQREKKDEFIIKEGENSSKQKEQLDKAKRAEKNQADKTAKEEARLKLKLARDDESTAKPEPEEPKQAMEKTTIKDLNIKSINIRKPSFDDLILQLVKMKKSTGEGRVKERKSLTEKFKTKEKIKGVARLNKYVSIHSSDLEFGSAETMPLKKSELQNIIIGKKIFKFKPWLKKRHRNIDIEPLLFQSTFKPSTSMSHITQNAKTPEAAKIPPVLPTGKQVLGMYTVDPEASKGVIRYALSDRSFIDKGWTMLPTEKVVRKMNVYRMRPAQPEFDWFEHNKNKRLMEYDSGEKLAEFDDNGRGRWFYKNGRMALDYYDAEELNANQRFVIYSSGEPDEYGRARPYTLLATFDYMGNGIVYDHNGKTRLKYNQTEGVVLDRSIGPESHWKWHTLNDPPVLQQVMIDTQMAHKDPGIMKLGGPNDTKSRPDNEDMLAIEFDNFIKEKSKKLTQSFKPFQIKMKALKINEHFSLKVLDQATVYLIFRDGTTNLKLNIGMVLNHKEIVDTDTAEVGEVSNNMERFPARTDSLAGLQKNIAHAQRYNRTRTERERRLRPPEPCGSADKLTAAASRPLRLPLRTGPSGSTTTAANCFCK